jgi:hypothetical protein
MWREKNGPVDTAGNTTLSGVEFLVSPSYKERNIHCHYCDPFSCALRCQAVAKDLIHYYLFLQCENNPDAWKADYKYFG